MNVTDEAKDMARAALGFETPEEQVIYAAVLMVFFIFTSAIGLVPTIILASIAGVLVLVGIGRILYNFIR